MRALFVLVFALGALLGGCIYPEDEPETLTTPMPQPTPIKEWSAEELKANTVLFKQDTGFAVESPYQGTDFQIEYEGPIVTYYVTIEAQDEVTYRSIKQKVEMTFIDAGAEELCGLKIVFFPPKMVAPSLEKKDFFATGCKPFF